MALILNKAQFSFVFVLLIGFSLLSLGQSQENNAKDEDGFKCPEPEINLQETYLKATKFVARKASDDPELFQGPENMQKFNQIAHVERNAFYQMLSRMIDQVAQERESKNPETAAVSFLQTFNRIDF